MSTSQERGVEAVRLLSVIVVVILSFSSFAVLASHFTSGADDVGFGGSYAVDSFEYPLSSVEWDWAALADEDGFVDVIVSVSCDSQDASSLARAMSRASACCAAADLDAVESAACSVRTFGHSLNGFAARLDLCTIDSLIASEPSLSVYPDLPLNATNTDGVRKIGADKVWTMTDPLGTPVTGAGIIVAVIDTGIDYNHPDLGGGFGPSYKVIGGYDFVNNDDDPMDDNGHGTHVAGTIAANGEVLGVAPDAKLLAYKALGAGGSGSMSDVIEAIDAALDPNGDGQTNDHADIISMSLGGAGSTDDPVCQAVERAVAAGVVVVIAAGNEGPSLGTVATPGLAPCAITVGAVDSAGNLAAFSSRGPTPEMCIKPEISAPGVDILSTVPYSGTTISSPTGYATLSGTSMATPHVSGSAALLLQLYPSWTPAMVKSAIITGSAQLDEPLWTAGAGEVYVPDAAATVMFSSEPMISYGLAGSASQSIMITNTGSSASCSVSSTDHFSMTANGSISGTTVTDVSSVSPLSLSIPSGGSGTVTLTVGNPSISCEEGYYEGTITLQSSYGQLVVPFGFVVLSTLNVHVYDMSGREVFDPYGGVWVYDIPDADFAMGYSGETVCSPPATFFLPSGTYSVHAMGHQLLYTYSDPYVLSSTVTVDRLDTVDLDIFMADANAMTLDLQTEGGQPVYVKDYRVYCRHDGARNISFDLTGSDYSITGSEVFSIPGSKTVYVSDTSAEVGISIAGFAYTPDMWNFMKLNWQHWYEYTSGTSTAFMVEASADLQYLLAWEFDGIDSSTPMTLTWDESTAAVFETKYDIPGSILNPWCNWGTHRSIGGDAAFYVRRDTDTSLNPFFSGMTRTTVVTGTFAELYFPRSVVGGYSERQFFTVDYDYVVKAATASGVYLPDRNYLQPLAATYVEERFGSGPFYPSLYTENTDSTMVLFHPLLRDQSDARVGGAYIPSMSLYRNGGLVGVYQLSEYLARPDAQRMMNLFGDGTYIAKITYLPTSQISSSVAMDLKFTVPSTDRDPPKMTGFEMAQRFVPGSTVPLSLDVADTQSTVTVAVSWRAGSADSWKALTVTSSGSTHSASIPTTTSTATIDLKITLTDSYTNYMSAVITSAAMAEIPVTFTLAPQSSTVEYKDATVAVSLEGVLKDSSGNPLHSTAAVPIELFSGGRKIAMILDEYILGTTHSHNGNILFQWMFNPTTLFTGTGQSVQVSAVFDLGIYKAVTVSFTLTSVPSNAVAPIIELVSPTDGSLIAAGTVIDLDVSDDGLVEVLYSLDAGAYVTLAEPWDISTSEWSDGAHSLGVTVMDDDGFTVTASYSFDVDASAPDIDIVQPLMGSMVPIGFEIVVSVSDAHLSGVTYSVDGSGFLALLYPYRIDMTGWDIGLHVVTVAATDAVGHSSEASVGFEIINSTIVAMLASPEDGAHIRSGTPLQLVVYSSGAATCSWSTGGPWAVLPSPYAISTDEWDEGPYTVSVSASDDLGGLSEFSFAVTVDDTLPVISLMWPQEGAYVTPDDIVSFQVTDEHLSYAVWSVLGISETTYSGTFTVSLSSVDLDGAFTLNVFAYDHAGNMAEDAIVFTMDLYDPVVGFEGLESGDSIRPGEGLVIEAVDSHLTSITLSVDGGSAVTGYPGMTVGTDALAPGWHSFELTVVDMAGRMTVEDVDIYVDGTEPVVQLSGPLSFVEGEPLELVATVSDDFGLAEGTVSYELEDGGFDSVAASIIDEELTAAIPAEALWDGMEVYVSVSDLAGNTGESERVVVAVAGGSDGSWFSSLAGIASLAAIAASAVALTLFMFMRGRSDEERPRRGDGPSVTRPARTTSRPKAEAHRGAHSPGPHVIPVAVAAVSSVQPRPPAFGRQTILDQVPEDGPTVAVPGHVAVGSMKAERVEAPVDEDEVDYGELIERELIKGAFNRSVYQKEIAEATTSRPVAPVPPEDRIISAMKLKKLMDGELLDDDSLF